MGCCFAPLFSQMGGGSGWCTICVLDGYLSIFFLEGGFFGGGRGVLMFFFFFFSSSRFL